LKRRSAKVQPILVKPADPSSTVAFSLIQAKPGDRNSTSVVTAKTLTTRPTTHTHTLNKATKLTRTLPSIEPSFRRTAKSTNKVLKCLHDHEFEIKDRCTFQRGICYSIVFSEAKSQLSCSRRDYSPLDTKKKAFLDTQTFWERPPAWCTKARPDPSPLLFCIKATCLEKLANQPQNSVFTEDTDSHSVYDQELYETEDDSDYSDDEDSSDEGDNPPGHLYNEVQSPEALADIERQTKIAYLCMATHLTPNVLRKKGYFEQLDKISFSFPTEGMADSPKKIQIH